MSVIGLIAKWLSREQILKLERYEAESTRDSTKGKASSGKRKRDSNDVKRGGPKSVKKTTVGQPQQKNKKVLQVRDAGHFKPTDHDDSDYEDL
ncbi:hypothetical protein OC845_005985 [Tilletia horrida]|nr:hypothetical protein OC845_005985 [Tilletia horrida]